MAGEPRASPDEPEGDEDEIPREHEKHEPHGDELGGAAAGELAGELEVRVEDGVVTE